MTNEETIIRSPRSDCQILAQAFSIFFESPPAFIKPNPPNIRLKNPHNPAMTKTSLKIPFIKTTNPVNFPDGSMTSGMLEGGLIFPMASAINIRFKVCLEDRLAIQK